MEREEIQNLLMMNLIILKTLSQDNFVLQYMIKK